MSNTIEIQQSLLSTYLWGDSELLKAIEIKDKWFTIPLHGLIVKCVKWLLMKDLEISQEVVLYYISKNNNIDLNEWLLIVGKNPFGTINTVKSYHAVLEDDSRKAVYDI